MNKNRSLPFAAVALAGALSVNHSSRAEEGEKHWWFDNSIYGTAVGMSGNMTIKGVPVDVDVPFGTVLDHLEFGAFARARVGYDRWSFGTDLIYAGLEGSKGPVTVDVDQWLVTPTVEYQVCRNFDAYAGARYNNLRAEVRTAGQTPSSGTVDWWEPVLGGRVKLPIFGKLSFQVMGDIGGLGVGGSGLSWQVEPILNYQFNERFSVQAGYRWIQTDYEKGAGKDRFRYDVLTQGPQLGLTIRF